MKNVCFHYLINTLYVYLSVALSPASKSIARNSYTIPDLFYKKTDEFENNKNRKGHLKVETKSLSPLPK